MALRPRTLLAAAVLAALLAAPAAQAQATVGSVSASTGNLTLRIHPSSALANNLVVAPSQSWDMSYAPDVGSGWGACSGAGAARACVCPTPSTCPPAWPPSASASTQSGTDYGTSHRTGGLQVAHHWRPLAPAAGWDVVAADVTVSNAGPSALQNVHYRRGEAFTWPGGAGFATMTIGSRDPTATAQWLVASSDLGMASPMPGDPLGAPPGGAAGSCAHTVGPGYASGGSYFMDVPESSRTPCQPGGMAEVYLGDLAAGGSASFAMFYGFSANETAALSRLQADLGADFWFLSQGTNPNQAASGTPFTYFWAFVSRGPPAACTPNTCPSCPGPCGPSGNGTGGGCPAPCGAGGADPGNATMDDCPPPSTCGAPQRQGSQQAPPPSSPGAPPAASSSRFPTDPAPGQPVTFTDHSVDADGAVVAWSWDLGDGATAAGRQAVHAYAAGTYTVRLTVTDDAGASATHAQRLTVAAPAPGPAPPAPAPAAAPARAGLSQRSGLGGAVDECGRTTCGTATHQARPVPGPPIAPAGSAALGRGSESLAPLLAVVALGGIAAVAAAGRRRWPWRVGIPLFSRLRRSDLLDHPVRSQVAELVEAEPGLHAMELARRTGRSRSDVQHHLRVLSRAGILKRLAAGGMVRYFPGPARPDPATLAQGPASRRVLAAVAAAPGLTVAQLAERSGMGYGAAHYHVRRLEKAGLVELRDAGQMRAFPRAPVRPASAAPA